MISSRKTVLALACAAMVALVGFQPAQADNYSSGIYGESGDYESPNQFADGGTSPAGTTSPPVAPVPEPGTITLVALGLFGLHRRMRKSSRS